MIQMKAVSSSQIASIGHDPALSVMRVMFNNGSTYDYSNVTQELFEKILYAPSVGAAFSALIKKNPKEYPFRKV